MNLSSKPILFSAKAATHGFDDIGELQGSGNITDTAQAGGRWSGKTMITSADHGLKVGAPIIIAGITAYNGLTRVLRVVDSDRFIINKDFDSDNSDDSGTWSAMGGESAWIGFMPMEENLPAANITTLEFYENSAQGGDQNVQLYTKDKMYFFPDVIKQIQISAGNVRLFRHATLNPGGRDLT